MNSKVFFLSLLLACRFFSTEAQSDSARLYQKTEQLFNTMNMADVFAAGVTASTDQQLVNVPALASHKEEVRTFFMNSIGWAAVKDDVKKLYSKLYTEEEIDVLNKFYQTSAGKKTGALNSSLQQEIQKIEQGKIQAHISDFNQILSKVNSQSSGTTPAGQ